MERNAHLLFMYMMYFVYYRVPKRRQIPTTSTALVNHNPVCVYVFGGVPASSSCIVIIIFISRSKLKCVLCCTHYFALQVRALLYLHSFGTGHCRSQASAPEFRGGGEGNFCNIQYSTVLRTTVPFGRNCPVLYCTVLYSLPRAWASTVCIRPAYYDDAGACYWWCRDLGVWRCV